MLFHNKQSNDSRFNNAQFLQNIYFSLDTMNRVMGGHNLNFTKKLKDFTV